MSNDQNEFDELIEEELEKLDQSLNLMELSERMDILKKMGITASGTKKAITQTMVEVQALLVPKEKICPNCLRKLTTTKTSCIYCGVDYL